MINSTWEQIRREVRNYRSSIQPSNVVNIKDFCFDEESNRAYFLATDSSWMKTSTLFVVDLPSLKEHEFHNQFSFSFSNNEFQVKDFPFTFPQSISCDKSITTTIPTNSDHIYISNLKSNKKQALKNSSTTILSNKLPVVHWRPLLSELWLKEKSFSETLSREELFVKERRRLALQGIASYQFDPIGCQILFSYGSGIYLGHIGENGEFNPIPITPRSSSIIFSGNSMNFSQISHSPHHNNLSPITSPSTTSSSSSSPPPPLPSFCTSPNNNNNNLLPPRLDPKLGGQNQNLVAFIRDRDIWVSTMNGCETQLTFCNDHDPDGNSALSCGVAEFVMQEEFHRFTGYYWAPTSTNKYMKDTLERILYLQISESMVDLVLISRPGSPSEVEEYRYPRAGRLNAVSDLQIVEFSPRYYEDEDPAHGPVHKRLWGCATLDKLFPWMEYIVRFGWCSNGNSVWVQFLDRPQKRMAMVRIPIRIFMSLSEYQESEGKYDEFYMSQIEVIFEERSNIWINWTYFIFFNDNETTTLSKHNSYPTNDYVESTKLFITTETTGFRHLYLVLKYSNISEYSIRQITAGNWPIVDRPIFVDTRRELVYFTAKKDTPLETHLYVASYAEGAENNEIIRLTELGYSHIVVMDEKCEKFLDWFSSINDKPCCGIRYLEWVDDKCIFPKVSENMGILVKGGKEDDKKESEERRHSKQKVPVGEFFDFINKDGVKIYGCLYKPDMYVPGKKYPTLLTTHFDFAVVLIDGRGSSDRGIEFESYLRGRMGTVELEDQIAGLRYLASNNMGVDLDRVAITGWSYGGYLSLMALAQYPDIFKLSIAGAPVTQWELYDTAYTERYMGLPAENIEGYHNGSVLTWADRFPDNEHRLLIAHGQIDENVHFKNSELLVSALVRHNKPHVLQPYPAERHGLRHANVAEHFETLMFFWLLNYL
ncbi:7760_t:CDS:10 [Entrophospora sp. SA101]|nr:7760_t:CDS:10 [Entrophospora sp. SA101]